MVFVSLFLHVL